MNIRGFKYASFLKVDMNIEIFDVLKKIYNSNGYRLYMIGSTSRDFLLSREINDFDFVTDATPSESLKFLKANETFKRFGVLKLKVNNKNVDIATLRIEKDYEDFRHPKKIEFIKDISLDYYRRDFTINAIYINENYEVEKISTLGVEDLKNRTLRFIGDPLTRIKEDPLRILRAKRFIKEYGLKVDDSLMKILKDNEYLIERLNKDKVKEENRKYDLIKEIE